MLPGKADTSAGSRTGSTPGTQWPRRLPRDGAPRRASTGSTRWGAAAAGPAPSPARGPRAGAGRATPLAGQPPERLAHVHVGAGHVVEKLEPIIKKVLLLRTVPGKVVGRVRMRDEAALGFLQMSLPPPRAELLRGPFQG